MGSRKEVLSEYMGKRLKRSRLILHISLAVLLVSVIRDSFTHDLPFHYILFFLGGLIIGRMFIMSHSVEYDVENMKIELKTNHWAIVFLMLLILVRFIVGPYVLNKFHFVYVSDALALLYLGIKWTKWRIILKDIDSLVYSFARRNIRDK